MPPVNARADRFQASVTSAADPLANLTASNQDEIPHSLQASIRRHLACSTQGKKDTKVALKASIEQALQLQKHDDETDETNVFLKKAKYPASDSLTADTIIADIDADAPWVKKEREDLFKEQPLLQTNDFTYLRRFRPGISNPDERKYFFFGTQYKSYPDGSISSSCSDPSYLAKSLLRGLAARGLIGKKVTLTLHSSNPQVLSKQIKEMIIEADKLGIPLNNITLDTKNYPGNKVYSLGDIVRDRSNNRLTYFGEHEINFSESEMHALADHGQLLKSEELNALGTAGYPYIKNQLKEKRQAIINKSTELSAANTAEAGSVEGAVEGAVEAAAGVTPAAEENTAEEAGVTPAAAAASAGAAGVTPAAEENTAEEAGVTPAAAGAAEENTAEEATKLLNTLNLTEVSAYHDLYKKVTPALKKYKKALYKTLTDQSSITTGTSQFNNGNSIARANIAAQQLAAINMLEAVTAHIADKGELSEHDRNEIIATHVPVKIKDDTQANTLLGVRPSIWQRYSPRSNRIEIIDELREKINAACDKIKKPTNTTEQEFSDPRQSPTPTLHQNNTSER